MTDAPTIGVVGSPDVASALRSIGFQVITGADFRSTATEISQRLKNGGDFPVVIADQANTPALSPWTIKTATQTHLVVLGTTPGSGLLEGKPNRLELPATVNDLLGKLRYQGTTRPIGEHLVQLDGAVTEPGAASVEPAPLPLPLPEAPIAEAPADPAPVAAAESVVAETAQALPAVSARSSATQGFPDDLFTSSSSAPAVGAELPQPQPQPQLPPPAAVLPPAPVHIPEVLEPQVAEEADAAPVPPQWPSAPVAVEPAPVQHQPAMQVQPEMTQQARPQATAPGADPWLSQAQPHATPTVPVQRSEQPPAPVDESAFFTRRSAAVHQDVQAQPRRPHGTLGEVIISAAGKGGVGKTTTSIELAELASEAGLSAIIVDANRGQADLRKYLRLGDAPLRTVYDVFVSGDPSTAILRPADYGHLRQSARLDVTDFAIVLGPPADQADPRYASAAVYGRIIDYARTIADIVIVDTQIIEAHRTDLWDDLLIPLLRGDAWLVAITDESSPGVSNLLDRLGEMQRAGVPNARTLVLATQYDNFTDEDARFFQSKFQSYGTLVGATGVDLNFHNQMNMGRIISDSPAIAPTMNAILLRATGRADLFAPTPPDEGRKKGGFLGGLFGGRR